MIIDGSKVLTVRGTLLVALEDGRDVTIEVAPLDLDFDDRSNRGHQINGIKYFKEESEEYLPGRERLYRPGPPYVTVDAALRSTTDELYTLTIPNKGA